VPSERGNALSSVRIRRERLLRGESGEPSIIRQPRVITARRGAGVRNLQLAEYRVLNLIGSRTNA
jgi:hypothetical protein